MSTTTDNSVPSLTIRVSAQCRRIGVYLCVGCILLLAELAYARHVRDQTPGWGRFAVTDLWVALAVLLPVFLIFRYRLCVDGAGIWRRRLWGWDLWSWEAFATTQARPDLRPALFVHSGKPWWTHHLHLGFAFLSESDRNTLLRLIQSVSPSPVPPPPPPPLPGKIEIRYGADLTERLAFSDKGIRVSHGRLAEGTFYPWTAAGHLRLTYYRHARPNLLRLELALAGREKPIRFGQGARRWTGPDNDLVIRYLRQHLPSERVELTAREGPARNAAEAARQLAMLDREERMERRIFRCMSVAWWLMLAFMLLGRHPNPLHWDSLRWLVAGLVLPVWSSLPVALLWMSSWQRGQRQTRRAELAGWQDMRSL